MTIQEALTSSLLDLGIKEAAITRALIDSNLDGTAAYTADTKQAVIQAEYDLLSVAYVESISQGGYTIKYNTAGIKLRLQALANKLGLDLPGETQTPTVRAVNYW